VIATTSGGVGVGIDDAVVDDVHVEPGSTGAAQAPAAEPAAVERLAYNPALDGIRGLAVAAVLLFHGGFEWARGGYLGVSTFFTLSGFLITSLLLVEHRGAGRVSFTRFWARRLRRLLPASLVTLALVSLLGGAVDEAWEGSLQGDVRAALLNVANWRFLWDDRSYAELFASPSPVLHFWSLAIEEQFYWLFPLVAGALLWLARGRRAMLGGMLAALVAAVAVVSRWPQWVGLDRLADDTVYYATPERMAEILVGALLAVLLVGWLGRGRSPFGDLDVSLGSRLRITERVAWPVVGLAGAGALALSAWAWWNVEQSTPLLYRGGLVAYAGLSALLVLGACVPGPLRGALSFEPLRLLGVVSYGVYLIHWPVFLVLDEERVDRLLPFGWHAAGVSLFLVRLVPTLALAVASYHWLERPIRVGRRPRLADARLLAVGGVAGVLALTAIVPRVWKPPVDPFTQIQQAQEDIAGRIAATPPSVPRGLFFGDSFALTTSAGVGGWGLDNQRLVLPGGRTEMGCGIGRGGLRRQHDVVGEVPVDQCDWEVHWAEEVAAHPEARVAVILTGTWDVIDRQIPGDGTWRHPGDPVYDAYLRGELAAATDLLRDAGLRVVWLTTPDLDFGRDGATPTDPSDHAVRVARLNELIGEVVAERQGTGVSLVDFAGWVAALPSGEDERLRPDGVHTTLGTAYEVGAWLGPEILRSSGLE
jgi:peptidoglycan/LPS O-acetylase OafA/YrhL